MKTESIASCSLLPLPECITLEEAPNMPTFKEMFCAHYDCPSDRFDHEAFVRCIHRRPSFVLWFARTFKRTSLLNAMELIDRAGEIETEEQLESLIHDYRRRNVETGWFTIRVSGNRLQRLFLKVKTTR